MSDPFETKRARMREEFFGKLFLLGGFLGAYFLRTHRGGSRPSSAQTLEHQCDNVVTMFAPKPSVAGPSALLRGALEPDDEDGLGKRLDNLQASFDTEPETPVSN